jgi:hypothetical protein
MGEGICETHTLEISTHARSDVERVVAQLLDGRGVAVG